MLLLLLICINGGGGGGGPGRERKRYIFLSASSLLQPVLFMIQFVLIYLHSHLIAAVAATLSATMCLCRPLLFAGPLTYFFFLKCSGTLLFNFRETTDTLI